VTQRDDLGRAAVTVTPEAPAPGARRDEPGKPGPDARSAPAEGRAGAAGRTGAASRSSRAPGPAARSAPRRARLALKRIDPWSVLKLSLVLSLALFVVGLVAVAVLYGVLEGMGVPQAVNETVSEVTAGAGGEAGIGDVLTLRRALTVTAVVGVVNAVLLTALATLSAFLYNLCADVVGGIDVTLSERD
jgi:hypothetical protein